MLTPEQEEAELFGSINALNKHMEEESKAEEAYYSLIEEFEEMKGAELDDVIEIFKHLATANGVDIEFIDYLREKR